MNNKLILALILGTAAAFFGCRDEEPLGEITVELTAEESDELLRTSGGFRDKLRGSGIGGPMGILFQFSSRPTDGKNTGGGRIEKSVLLSIRDMYHLNKISTWTLGGIISEEIDEELPECANETYEYYSDGTYKYELDFGDGCEAFGSFLKGKVVETGRYRFNSFESTTEFTNFGQDDWTANGTDSFVGSVTIDAEYIEDSLVINDWEVIYSFDSDLVEEHSETINEVQEVRTLQQKSSGSETMNEDTYMVRFRSASFAYETGERYSSYVVEPLQMHYDCNEQYDVITFVSGIERGIFTVGDQTADYAIDYGDGICDNFVTVTENGESTTLDVNDLD